MLFTQAPVPRVQNAERTLGIVTRVLTSAECDVPEEAASPKTGGALVCGVECANGRANVVATEARGNGGSAARSLFHRNLTDVRSSEYLDLRTLGEVSAAPPA